MPECRRCAVSATARSGKCWKAPLPRAELLERSIYATRQFAKRQLTWLRSMKDIGVVDTLESATANRVQQKIGSLK